MKFDFMSAKLAHQRWRIRLRMFLDGNEPLSITEATSARDCALGQWLYGTGMKEYGNISELQELERIHAQMHSLVRGIIDAQTAGRKQDAERDYMTLGGISDQIISLLDAVERRVV